MTAQPIRTARMAAALLVTATTLAACGDKQDRFAPPCPSPTILPDLGDLRRYNGRGQDIVDTVLEGRVVSIEGSCTRTAPGIVTATVSIGLDLSRGPAATSRTADLAWFIALTDGDNILDKRVFPLRPTFPPNVNRLRLVGDQIDINIPVSSQKSAAAYRIVAGFELTPAEVAVNRERRTRSR